MEKESQSLQLKNLFLISNSNNKLEFSSVFNKDKDKDKDKDKESVDIESAFSTINGVKGKLFNFKDNSMPIDRIFKTYNHLVYYEMVMKKRLEDELNVASANNAENKAIIRDKELAIELANSIAVKEKEIKMTNDFIMHEYHEGLICDNILKRNTVDYIIIREKLRDIYSLIKQFENKNTQVTVYFENCVNMRNEFTEYKRQLIIENENKRKRRERHLNFLETERKRIDDKNK